MALALVAALTLAMANPLDQSLARVPERAPEWRAFLKALPKDQLPAARYLLTYMPLGDLKALPTTHVGEAVQLAMVARRATTWAAKVPQDVFLDAVAPYASVTEPRQSMRAEFQKRYLPAVKATKSPGEAALLINKTLFADYKVTYNPRRLRTDQSPPETIAQGMATCTGLSIMLVDALRAVGVPARLAGIPAWPGRGGNHTWVEVWDAGSWHFVGAAEPDEKGLNHGWFAEEAGRVPGTNPMETIYAVTYKTSPVQFPLVWDPGGTINAENVTPRYRMNLEKAAPRLMVEVRQNGERVVAEVTAIHMPTGDRCLQGRSLGPQADINLHLMAPAQEGERYEITVRYKGKTVTTTAFVKGDTVVRINLDEAQVAAALKASFEGDMAALKDLPFTEENAKAAWGAYLAAPDADLRAEFDAKIVKTSERTAPYLWRTVGTKPATGWGLVIAMHGGGGVPKEFNDEQWRGMFEGYYRDQPEAGGYIYLALRAPNDVWDGFYDNAISPLVERLIRQFVKFAEVDPNQVVACGASHGGYGAFVIGPKIPYRFSALHPAAAAQTPDRTMGENLRNVHFTWAVGEHDTAYNRIGLAREFQTLWEGWRAKYGGFEGGFTEVKGKGHGINEHEANQIAVLRKPRRTPHPKKVIWVQSDTAIRRFYWLEAMNPQDKGRVEASIDGNTITLVTKDQGGIALWLSSALIDLNKPVVVVRDGVRKEFTVKPSLEVFAAGLLQTGDPGLSAPVRLVVH